ncbi:hypothetical protein SLA2020_087180 [Shorea laevis]
MSRLKLAKWLVNLPRVSLTLNRISPKILQFCYCVCFELRSASKHSKRARGCDVASEEDSDFETEELIIQNGLEEDEDKNAEEIDGDSEDEENGEEGSEEEEEEEGEDEEELETEDDGNDKDDVHKSNEIEELEREHMDLHQQEQDISKNLKCHKNEDLKKGQAVKNQRAFWDKTLEFRFLLQKVSSSSNR